MTGIQNADAIRIRSLVDFMRDNVDDIIPLALEGYCLVASAVIALLHFSHPDATVAGTCFLFVVSFLSWIVGSLSDEAAYDLCRIRLTIFTVCALAALIHFGLQATFGIVVAHFIYAVCHMLWGDGDDCSC